MMRAEKPAAGTFGCVKGRARGAAVALLAALVWTGLPATSRASKLTDAFDRVKSLVKANDFTAALAALDALDREAAAPENEPARAALAPAAAFYRGVCLASLGRSEQARAQFAIYRAANPGRDIDRKAFARPVVAAFDAALAQAGPPSSSKDASSLAAAYRRTRAPAARQVLLEEWASGPVRFLLTPDEARSFSRLSDEISRAEFVARFWCAGSGAPDAAGRREEFERRAAFADEQFGEGNVRGSATDRGMAFLLLGPPSGVFRRPIARDRDTPDMLPMTGGANPAPRSSIGLSPSDQPVNWREVWRYNREELPAGSNLQQAELSFETRTDYGTRVLQRDAAALRALEAGRSAWRAPCPGAER